MQINQMKAVRARQLYDAEITTPAQLAQLEAGFFSFQKSLFQNLYFQPNFKVLCTLAILHRK